MLTPDRFVTAWTEDGSELVTCPASALEGIALEPAARTFLREVGLPKEAHPFLTFGFPEKGRLQNVLQVLEISDEEIEDDEDRVLAKELWVIGADGSDKICVANDGRVMLFDHSMLGTLPINSSLGLFGSSLLAYREYTTHGRAEELIGKKQVDEAKERLRSIVRELRFIDAASYDKGGWWQRVLGAVLLRVGQDPASRSLGLEVAEILSPPR